MGAAVKLQEPTINQGKTAPRTLEGKRRSSLNATKHGIRAKEDVLPWEDREEFEEFVKVTVDYFGVEHPYEVRLVRRLAGLQWRQERLKAYEHVLAIDTAIAERIDTDLRIGQMRPPFRTDSDQIAKEHATGLALYERLSAVYSTLSSAATEKGRTLVPQPTVKEMGDVLEDLAKFSRMSASAEEVENPRSWLNRIKVVQRHLDELMFETPQDSRAATSDDAMRVPTLIHLKNANQVCKALIALHGHVLFLKQSLQLASEREYWTSGSTLAKAQLPPQNELDKLIRYGRHLDRSIREVMNQLERANTLRATSLVQ